MENWEDQKSFQVLRVGQLLIAAAPGEFTTMAGRSNPGVNPLRGQRLFETFPLQASSRDSGRRVEGGVHSGGGRVGKLVHALHHHLGGVPDPEVSIFVSPVVFSRFYVYYLL